MAVLRDDDILAELQGDSSLMHAERLPADLARALDLAGVSLDDVTLLAVVAGPGSFTGLRVGIAAMQGLAFARRLSVVPVSGLDAVAGHVLRAGTATRDDFTVSSGPADTHNDPLVAPWIDAQRGEVSAALYDGAERTVIPPASLSPEAALELVTAATEEFDGRPVVFAGDGAVRYKDVIARTLGARAIVREPAPALAGEAARIAARHPGRAVAPHAIMPIYVRRPDVELTRGRAGR